MQEKKMNKQCDAVNKTIDFARKQKLNYQSILILISRLSGICIKLEVGKNGNKEKVIRKNLSFLKDCFKLDLEYIEKIKL